jgi:hypothetical protein
MELNVYALTYNAIFGQLWRAVRSQPPSQEQNALLNAFSSRVGAVKRCFTEEGLAGLA